MITLYDTLSRSIQELVPLNASRINMFVCGPTVYDYAHLGHGKTYTQFDFIARYLRYRGYDVFYLQNITDIDDKIIARANNLGISTVQLAERFTEAYLEDMKSLRNCAVTKYASASEYIDCIVDQIRRLIAKDFAYQTSDGYYFDISKFPTYGLLSKRAGIDPESTVSRIETNPEKRNPIDFVLWKARKPDEPYWSTAIGEGRPGWHIEDTAITEQHFGPQYDLHGGAVDLIFPHHEAEIAQSEAATGVSPMVRHWMHAGFLNIHEEKMSKSLKNFVTIRDALKMTSYAALRFWFISQHYRSSIDRTDDWVTQAEGGLARINNFVRSIDASYDDQENESLIQTLRTNVTASLDSDFNTPVALAHIYEMIREQHRSGRPGRRVLAYMKELNELFDFIDFSASDETLPEEIDRLIDKRQDFRKRRMFAEADAIRDLLITKGVILEDTLSGVKYHLR